MDVIVNFPGTTLPGDDAPAHYIVGDKGMYMRKKLPWVDATVHLSHATMLDPVVPKVTLSVPPVSGEVLRASVAFFRDTCRNVNASEAAVLLHYSPDLGWDYTVPEQQVNPAFAIYDPNQQLPGYSCIGTIHSHGRAAAYHSPTDHEDEMSFDGIHITVGDCDAVDGVSLSGEVVVNNNRFAYEDLAAIEGITRVAQLKYKRKWKSPPFFQPAKDPRQCFVVDMSLPFRPVSRQEKKRVQYLAYRGSPRAARDTAARQQVVPIKETQT